MWGLDAPHNRPFSDGSRVFQGPTRRGFENLGLGITWAAFNQARDDTKPTWTLGFDAKLDVFKDMRFDPANPTGNTAVGPGYHQFIWSTFVSKRFRYFDPIFGAWYNFSCADQRQPIPGLPGWADEHQSTATGGRGDWRRADRLGEPGGPSARHGRGAGSRGRALLRA